MDLKEFELLNKSRVKKREESLNDINILNKNLARLVSLAVWGNNQEFNKPLDKISLTEPDELSQSDFTDRVNNEMKQFLKSKGLI